MSCVKSLMAEAAPNTNRGKRKPRAAGASPKEKTPRGNLGAPILSEGTNQARRGTKCNVPGWAGGETKIQWSHAAPLKPRHRRKPGLFFESRPRRKRRI